MNGFAEAVAFLTPFGRARTPSRDAVPWFPAVGALLGLAIGTVWWLVLKWWDMPVAVVIVIVANLAFTGMLHFDGLVDAADGLLPHLTRERRLEVMSEPTVGAFGVIAVGVVLLTQAFAIVTVYPGQWRYAAALFVALLTASRSMMALALAVVPSARPEGLSAAFAGSPSLVAAMIGLAASVAVATVWGEPAGPVAVVSGVVAAWGVLVLARARIGGYTGDVLGAAGVVLETVGLVVAVARW